MSTFTFDKTVESNLHAYYGVTLFNCFFVLFLLLFLLLKTVKIFFKGFLYVFFTFFQMNAQQLSVLLLVFVRTAVSMRKSRTLMKKVRRNFSYLLNYFMNLNEFFRRCISYNKIKSRKKQGFTLYNFSNYIFLIS